MKNLKTIIFIAMLIITMSATVFAAGVNLNVKTDKNGLVKVTIQSEYRGKAVTIKVQSGNRTYYINQDETDNEGNSTFEFMVDKNKDYKGKINVNGIEKEFTFETKDDNSGSSSGGSSSGGSGSGGSSSSGSNDNASAKPSISGNVANINKNSIEKNINEVKNSLSKALVNVTNLVEKERIKKEVSLIPVKIDNNKGVSEVKFDTESVKEMKEKDLGVKVEFSDSEVKIPYTTVKELKDGEILKVKRNNVQNGSMLNQLKKDKKVLTKLYGFNVVKVDKNNKETGINGKTSYSVDIQIDESKLRGIKKESLKIQWYNKSTGNWETIESKYVPEKKMVIGNFN